MKHFSFDGFTLDPANQRLLRGEVLVPLAPKAFDTLVYLVEHHGCLVTRDELMKAIWPDSFVEGANLTVYISLLRKALGEEGGRRYIETVPRKGYRLVADVHVVQDHAAPEPEPAVIPRTPPRQRAPRWAIALGVAIAGAALWLPIGSLRKTPQPRRVRLTSFGPEMAITAAAISPDGKLIAYANPGGIFVQQIDTGEAHPLVAPAGKFTALSISWYPDEAKLLVGGFGQQADTPGLWEIQTLGENPPRRLGDGLNAAVSPDGKDIASSGPPNWSPPELSLRAAPEIRVILPDGAGPRTVVTGKPGETFGPVEWIRGERGLVWARYRWNPQLRRNSGSIDAYDLDTGKTSVVIKGSDFTGDVASIGGRQTVFAQLLGSNPSSKYGGKLLIIQQGSRPREITAWSEPTAGLSASATGGKLLVRNLLAEHSVFVADLSESGTRLQQCRRLTHGLGREDLPRAWTRDGQAVVFDSNRNGRWELFQQKLNDATDQPLLRAAGDVFTPRLSPDGTSFLYMERPAAWSESSPVSILRTPASGGPARLVLRESGISEWGLRFECPSTPGRACVLAQLQEGKLVFRRFDPVTGFGAGNEVTRIDADAAHPVAWTISPDGSNLAWTRWDPTAARIRVVPLTASSAPDQQVDVTGCSHIHSMHWSADGKGWFLTSEWPANWIMSYSDLEGRAHPLRQGLGAPAPDAFPSPDGHHLAFAEGVAESNLWMLEGF